ncbi:type II toxin-antitoxin system MqsA family antitoxin [Megasphaera sp.]|jgi:YgiT-type zinc finger domain-containing protein|uniref:type II toxin-antitoxin system MqsA family antitoxin n=3 Tax=Megasphaera sp. TaxID=2023260 RepID=UPI003076BF88
MMTNCTFCKGDLQDALTTFTIDLDSCIVIIRNVPSQVCTQCGETYYSTEVMQQLYKIADSVRNSMTEIAVVNYHSAA